MPWPDLGRISKLVQKTGMMCFSQDKNDLRVGGDPNRKDTKEVFFYTAAMLARNRRFLRKISRLQSRTQFQCCYNFARSASKSFPTIGVVRALNQMARQLKSQPVKLQFWPLKGPLRKIGYLHTISMLRKKASSGSIHDFVFFPTQSCLADCLTKATAKADNLSTAIKTAILRIKML